MQTTGNTIIITGGTSGIGLGFAELFMRLGNTVIVCGRREDRLDAIRERHPEIITQVCDVTITDHRKAFSEWVIENHPSANILLNNAGIQLATDLTHPAELDKVWREIETNLVAPVHFSSLFAQHFMKYETSAIINISSGLAFAPLAFMPIYCATKAAVHSFTLSLRHQLSGSSVRVFEIIPPSVDTELGHEHRDDSSQSHGGMPVIAFLDEALRAIQDDLYEAPIGQAKGLYMKREELFSQMNR
ncbi:MAG TPA: SDR family oxidoreductase [Spirochaetota bacterium]